MQKLLRLLYFLILLFVIHVASAQKITLSENAALDNSIILLKTLRNYYPADSLLKWAEQDGRSLMLCRVDSSGMILEVEKYRTFKNQNQFLSSNSDTISNILINNNTKFVFPCTFTGYSPRDREVFLQKESITKIYKENGYINLQIPIFYVMFPKIFQNLRESCTCNNIDATAENILEELFKHYISRHY